MTPDYNHTQSLCSTTERPRLLLYHAPFRVVFHIARFSSSRRRSGRQRFHVLQSGEYRRSGRVLDGGKEFLPPANNRPGTLNPLGMTGWLKEARTAGSVASQVYFMSTKESLRRPTEVWSTYRNRLRDISFSIRGRLVRDDWSAHPV